MGKKSSGSAPAAPDPYKVAAAQGAANADAAKETARMNRLNETTPFGTVQYMGTGNPNVPYRRITTLNPQEQKRLNAERALDLNLTNLGNQVLTRVAPDLASPFSIEGEAPVANDETRQRVEQALIDRLQPYIDRDEEAARTRLANQGFSVGSEGYSETMDDLARARNDARLAAISAGGDEMSRLFGLEQAARQQAIQEAVLERAQPINEIGSILGTAGPVNVPNFGGVPQTGVGPADLQGAIYNSYQGNLNRYNADRQSGNAMMGGLFGLAGAGVPFLFG